MCVNVQNIHKCTTSLFNRLGRTPNLNIRLGRIYIPLDLIGTMMGGGGGLTAQEAL